MATDQAETDQWHRAKRVGSVARFESTAAFQIRSCMASILHHRGIRLSGSTHSSRSVGHSDKALVPLLLRAVRGCYGRVARRSSTIQGVDGQRFESRLAIACAKGISRHQSDHCESLTQGGSIGAAICIPTRGVPDAYSPFALSAYMGLGMKRFGCLPDERSSWRRRRVPCLLTRSWPSDRK